MMARQALALLIAAVAVDAASLRSRHHGLNQGARGGDALLRGGSRGEEGAAAPPLSLAQLLAERSEMRGPAHTQTVHQSLFPVEVNMDFKDLEPSGGLSMVVAKGSQGMRLDMGLNPAEALAWGRFDDNIATTGWSELYMETSPSDTSSNTVKMYAAGFVEGVMTCVRISEFYANTFRLLANKPDALSVIKDVLQNQLGYLRSKTDLEPGVMAAEPSDPYWKQARYTLSQMWGITDGYNVAARHFGVKPLGLTDIAMINAGGELPQILEAYLGHAASFLQVRQSVQRKHASSENSSSDAAPAEDPLDDAHWEKRVATDGRCSAFVRLATGSADLLVGHTTWDDYSKMTRVFKYYKFPLHASDTAANHIAMSSYPGAVSSTDDYYVMDSGLTVTDTSIEVLEPAVWSRMPQFPVSPSIPNFIHVMAVNRLAKSGGHWASLFTSSGHNSHYAAQWMVIDYNLFSVGEALPDNVLWVIEVLPSTVMFADESKKLREQGYWGSFNRPYFSDIRQASGHFAAQRSHGDLYSWEKNPRAQIFKSAAASVNSMFDMRGLMTRNTFATSGMGPGHDISARMDLDLHVPLPNGGIDAKVVNRCAAKLLQVQAESGPSHAALSAFRWTAGPGKELWPGWPHIGQPDTWGFDFQQMGPLGSSAELVESTSC